MASRKRADWLDQVILQAKPGETPKADFDAWRNAHAGAIRRLRQRGAGIPRTTFLPTAIARFACAMTRSPMVRLTVAAALVAGVLILATSRTNRGPEPVERSAATTDRPARSTPESTDPVEKELRFANELFLRGDVQGLLALLDTGQPRTVFAVAIYLGQIGDASSLPALQTFAAQWQGPAEENPFQEAIDQIRRGNEQDDAKLAAPPRDRVVAIPLASEPSSSDKERQAQICRGVVVNKTGVPLGGAMVWAQDCTRDLKLADLTTPVRTDPQGRFRLTVPIDHSGPGNRIYLLCKHPGYALGWLRLPVDPETRDFENCRIVLYEPTVVAGTVADAQGRSISGALVEARVVAEHDPTSAQEYPYAADNERAARTDGLGRFILKDVPEGSLLSLSVSRRGYASYDSREGYGSLLGTWQFIDPETYTVRAGREDVAVELLPARGRIDGRVLNDRGGPYDEPVAILCQDWNHTFHRGLCRRSAAGCTLMQSVQRGACSLDGKGRFRIEDLPAGRYWVTAIDPISGDPVTPPVGAIIAESRPRVDVTLRAAGVTTATVRVRQETGAPVRDVLVVARSGILMHRYTDANGLCVFRSVRDDYIITAHGLVYNSRAAVGPGRHSGRDRNFDVVVEALPQIPGRLTDESGRPVRGSVNLFGGERISTDGDGRFTIPRRPGPLVGHATNMEGTRARMFSHPAADEVAALEIRLEPLATVTGRVLDESGNLADNVRVLFSLFAPPFDPEGSFPDHLQCGLTLSEGRFRFEVPVGTSVTLVAFTKEHRGRSEPVVPAPGQTYDLGDILLQQVSSPAFGTGQSAGHWEGMDTRTERLLNE